MKIVFTGGGSGGHFYPIIAIAEAVHDVIRERHILEPKLYYFAPDAFDAEALFENRITYVRIPAGKWRRYFSLKNPFDILVTLGGSLIAVLRLFSIYPDVVISKGGFGSVPTVIAARILGIPIIIHESDAKPGRANLFAAKFATRIAVSYESAIPYFGEKAKAKATKTGAPVRRELMMIETEGARQELGLDPAVPTILVLGGSLGAMNVNEAILSVLPELVGMANIIHQTGKSHIKEVEGRAAVALRGNPLSNRYHPFAYLSVLALRRSAGTAALIISRAGSGAIAEIAAWRRPAILVPIPESVSHDQRMNAYAYAHTGAAVVIEEGNMTPTVIASEIRRILNDEELRKSMAEKGAAFASPEAARIIADEAVAIGLSHEQ